MVEPVYLYLLTGLFFLGWLFYLVRERRTLLAGFLTLAVATLAYGSLFYLAFERENALLMSVVGLASLPLILAFIFTPLVLVVVFYYSGLKLIRREGVSVTNLLSLALATALLLSFFFVPGKAGNPWFYVYTYLSLLVTYLSVLALSFTVTALLNLLPLGRRNLDYVVVLGSGLRGDRVTPLLAGRVDKGIEVYRANPGSKLVMTGGQGPDELVSEAEAMARYAQMQGVAPEDIIREDRARNTRENLLYSWELMTVDKPRVLVATTSYHLLRALLLARNLGLACSGAGARTKFYFSANAFIREFIGYLAMTRKLQLLAVGGLTLCYLAGLTTYYYLDIRGFLG